MAPSLALQVALLLCAAFSCPVQASNDTKELIRALLDPDVYDATIRPFQDEGTPVRISVDMVLTAIGPVNDASMDMSASMFLRQEWRDPRLAFSQFNHSLTLSHKLIETQVWVPDLYFPNGKLERRHDLTTPNILLRLQPDGTVLYSQRLSVTTSCFMDLAKFPHDSQTCTIKMESYSYATQDVYFVWSTARSSTDVLPDAYIPDFTLTNVSIHDCTAEYETGSFTCLESRLFLRREIGFYVTQTYVPSILIVMLSWASFWIDHEAVPARISVGLLTVLTITTQSSGARAQLPRVPYIKAIDVWMSLCLVFVFAAYMEYAVVSVLSRRHKKRANSPSKAYAVDGDSDRGAKTNGEAGGQQTPRAPPRHPGHLADKLSRFIFPISFLIFNLVYWVLYVAVPWEPNSSAS